MEFNATFIVAFISFALFTIIMNKILYAPISEIILKRKQFVDANFEEANKNLEKKDIILQEKTDMLNKAVDEAKSIVSDRILQVNTQKDKMTFDAKKEAQKNIDAYNLYYKNATKEAKEFLNVEIVNLAQAISDKFLNSDEKIYVDNVENLTEGVIQK